MSRRIESLVSDIADDAPVDWDAVGSASESGTLVREFRIIAAVGAGRDREEAREPRGAKVAQVLLSAAVGLAAVRFVVAVIAALTTTPFRIGPVAVTAVLLTGSGIVLMLGARRDRRALTLGTLFLIVGSAWAQPYLTRGSEGPVGWLAVWLRSLPPDAFIALALWTFAWQFPGPPPTRAARRVGVWFLGAASAVGLFLLFMNAINLSILGVAESAGWFARIFDRRISDSAFWPLSMAVGVPALPYLLWKSHSASVEERTRVTWFGLIIAAGLTPAVLAVAAFAAVPALKQSPFGDWLGFASELALVLMLPATAHAVLVKRVIDVHLVLRRALQHSLARKVVWATSLGPLVYVAVGLYLGQDRTVAELVTERVGLVAMSGVGFAALMFRHQLLRGVDRWFRRDAVDYAGALAGLVAGLDGQRSIRDLQMTLLGEVERTVRSSRASLLVLDDARSAFASLDGHPKALAATSTLAGLLSSTHRELHVAPEAEAETFRLLPRVERDWVDSAAAEWVFPLTGSSGTLIGMLCLGESRNGLAYSDRDRAFVSAMTSQVALRIENLSLLQWLSGSTTDARGGAPAHLVDWQNEPATQCPSCRVVAAPLTRACACGTPTVPAVVPSVLNGKFRMDRVLGSGGMGVVYGAVDMTLNRRVAVKTMPTVTPRYVARLQREAQAMASVGHPNLAMIFSVERWRDVPMLVVEYLEGGTLAEGLRAGPMSVEETLDLGIVLADALVCMHDGGLLHRDIKPSNIGYTADGVPKLLDFGLAAMFDRVDAEVALPVARSSVANASARMDTWSPTASRSMTQLVGTPLYLSPEALAEEEPDASFDLWSLSMVLYEAICGRHPLAGYPAVEAMRRTRSVRVPDVRDFRADCPPAVAAFLNDALSLSKERRPATAADLRVQLQSIRLAFGSPYRSPRPSLY